MDCALFLIPCPRDCWQSLHQSRHGEQRGKARVAGLPGCKHTQPSCQHTDLSPCTHPPWPSHAALCFSSFMNVISVPRAPRGWGMPNFPGPTPAGGCPHPPAAPCWPGWPGQVWVAVKRLYRWWRAEFGRNSFTTAFLASRAFHRHRVGVKRPRMAPEMPRTSNEGWVRHSTPLPLPSPLPPLSFFLSSLPPPFPPPSSCLNACWKGSALVPRDALHGPWPEPWVPVCLWQRSPGTLRSTAAAHMLPPWLGQAGLLLALCIASSRVGVMQCTHHGRKRSSSHAPQ